MGKKKTEETPKLNPSKTMILRDENGREYKVQSVTILNETPELFRVEMQDDELDRLKTLAIKGIRERYYYSIHSFRNEDLYNQEQEVEDIVDKLRKKLNA